MNTYTNALNEKKVHRTARKILSPKIAIMTAVLMLLTVAAIATSMANQPVITTENNPAVPYSNALELQYARPWLDAQNKPVVVYSNALELQYAQPWLEAQNKAVVAYGNALELQYAQPWLDQAELPIVVTGNVQDQIPLDCSASIEMLYACKYGYGRP